MSSEKRFYGWKKPDVVKIEHTYQIPAHLEAVALPPVVDLSPLFPPVYDQLDIGSCADNASAGLAEFLMMSKKLPYYTPSRLSLYYWARLAEGTINEDSGSSMQTAINVLVKHGIPNEKYWPYVTKNFTIDPPKAAWTDGLNHVVDKALSVPHDQTHIHTRLYEGLPIIFGFQVFESFESDQVAKTGVMPLPKPGEKIIGGHGIMCVGINLNTKMAICRNSWGISWGKSGYFEMPLSFFLDKNMCNDFWTCENFSKFVPSK